MLLSCGPPFICASLHGTVINTIQSLSSLDQFKDKDEVLKGLSLKMVELSHQRAYYLFGEWPGHCCPVCHKHSWWGQSCIPALYYTRPHSLHRHPRRQIYCLRCPAAAVSLPTCPLQ